MNVSVNGKPWTEQGGATTVRELVRSFYESGEFAGELVDEIQVDGVGVELEGEAGRSLDGIDSLELRTISAEGAYDQAARRVVGRVGLLRDALAAIIRAYRDGDENEALAAMPETVGHMQAILMEAAEVDLAKTELLRLETDAQVAIERPEVLFGALKAIVRAQEAEDGVLVIDLLEFELLPVIAGWAEALSERFAPAL